MCDIEDVIYDENMEETKKKTEMSLHEELGNTPIPTKDVLLCALAQ